MIFCFATKKLSNTKEYDEIVLYLKPCKTIRLLAIYSCRISAQKQEFYIQKQNVPLVKCFNDWHTISYHICFVLLLLVSDVFCLNSTKTTICSSHHCTGTRRTHAYMHALEDFLEFTYVQEKTHLTELHVRVHYENKLTKTIRRTDIL